MTEMAQSYAEKYMRFAEKNGNGESIMYICIDFLKRKVSKNTIYALDVDLSEDELISLFTDFSNKVPYDQMALATKIKEDLVRQYNEIPRRRKIKVEDISFHMESMQERAAYGIQDVESFVKQNESITVMRNDGSTITLTVKLGMVYKKDSRLHGTVSATTIDNFFPKSTYY